MAEDAGSCVAVFWDLLHIGESVARGMEKTPGFSVRKVKQGSDARSSFDSEFVAAVTDFAKLINWLF